ncbi:3'-5' exoribonuclease YhaM family protein [Longimicrobium sp.]|uniref:3'-5' exoribonuclease YhaM family protein n=1 Tax=Longimicrobium sp. TaxID=2029185 RepID=UPI002CF19CDA|nr:HD domain-containing protein [Longimicrobium sp.]HSU12723.1 HD domain-containing protein [Longimicrobium sp.]
MSIIPLSSRAAPRPDPRAFCGGTWPQVRELADGRDVVACFIVHDKQRKETKSLKPYLHLVLGDRTGTIDAKVWDDAERLDRLFAAEDVVGVRGRTSTYNGRIELTVTSIQPVEIGEDDLELFLPASPRDRGVMGKELDLLVDTVADPALRLLLQRMTGRKTTTGKQYRLHPAAKKNHHAYLGGLLEHSLSVAKAADALCAHYQKQGARVDRDLLVTGALLHDVGKVRELSAARTIAYTDEGQLLGHILIGLQMVAKEAEQIPGIDADRLLHLQHLIASHQGRHEWASPKVPQTLEAVILHYADDLDSKMNPAMAMLHEVPGGGWSAYDRSLERALFQPPEFPRTAQVEPVPAAEVVEVVLDMFRG